MKQLTTLSLLLLFGVALAACGSSGDSDASSTRTLSPEAADVLSAARTFYRTALDGRARGQCSLMSAQGKAETSQFGAGHGCIAALRETETVATPKMEAEAQHVSEELNSPAVEVVVYGGTATVDVPREHLRFEKEGGQWLLRSLLATNWRELLVFNSGAESRELKKFLDREQERPVKKVICPPSSPEKVGSRFDCVVEFDSGLRALAITEVGESQMRLRSLQGLPGEHWREEFRPIRPQHS